MDAQCPTCGQFTQLHNLVNELSFSLIELRSRVSIMASNFFKDKSIDNFVDYSY